MSSLLEQARAISSKGRLGKVEAFLESLQTQQRIEVEELLLAIEGDNFAVSAAKALEILVRNNFDVADINVSNIKDFRAKQRHARLLAAS